MNIDDRIRRQLEASTASLRAADRLEEVMADGRRRRIATRMGTLVAVAATLAAVVGVASLLGREPDNGPVATDRTTTSAAPTTTAVLDPIQRGDSVVGFLATGSDGITVVRPTGEEAAALTSDRYYEAIDVALPDRRGGLVYQHRVTPMPWPQGAILRLPAGAAEPSILVGADDGARLVPVGTGVSSDGHAVLVYLEEGAEGASIVALDLDDGSSSVVAETGPYVEVSFGGDLAAILDQESSDCVTVRLIGLDGDAVEPPPGCLPVGSDVAVSGDGTQVAVLANSVLSVYDSASGDLLATHDLEEAFAVVGGSAGWSLTSGGITTLIGDGARVQVATLGEGAMVPVDVPLDLPDEATLGSGSGDLPCSRSDLALAEQAALPDPVADTRRAIHTAASACDYEALARMVERDGTVVSVGNHEVDPIRHWVAEARLGDDPLSQVAGILTTTPATDPETGAWGWPGVAVDPAMEVSWSELAPLLGADAVQDMREAGSYLGRRVGITPDGRWSFATAGD